ncbi:MAG TPA: SOS response-associated peptidase, partial [Burkholderiales bacterium]|nr:SOS response-associated peptidase [Burkholderiales bacterium]
MCGRFVQLPLQFGSGLPPGVEQALQATPQKYNLAPTQRAAVVLDDQHQMAVRRFRWGLVPPWCKDLKQTYSTINARIETVAVKPAFRAAWQTRRCVVPMRGYYEWCAEDGLKQPYFLGLADGGDLFAAAIWEPKHRLQRED